MWIKRPSNTRKCQTEYVNLSKVEYIKITPEDDDNEFGLWFMYENQQYVFWYFKTEHERDTYIKENLERYMEITV